MSSVNDYDVGGWLFSTANERTLTTSTPPFATMGTYESEHNNQERTEKLRCQLEENVIKLQKSLQTWQTWEAEYEGLKEELGGLENEPTKEELVSF